MTDRSISHVLL